jgi:hypothetical protein
LRFSWNGRYASLSFPRKLVEYSRRLLLAALYDPVWISAIHRPADVGLAIMVLVALMFWRLPPWLVVATGGLLGWLTVIVLG